MKILLASTFLIFTLFQISCTEDNNPCDKDGDGILSRDCGGEDCNDGDKNSGIADADGDGFNSIACGGTDCNDLDPTTFPGNDEVNDAEGHDEDCNPSTCGQTRIDADNDGYGANCFQRINGVDVYSYTGDCDDNNAAIFPGSQVCGRQGRILICGGDGFYVEQLCKTCIVQPNGTGVCLN